MESSRRWDPRPAVRLFVRFGIPAALIVVVVVLGVMSSSPSRSRALVDGVSDSVDDGVTSEGESGVVDVDTIQPAGFGALWDLPASQRAQVDLARMNLIVASGAPDAKGLDIEASLATLDRWAQRVASETDRNMHLFRQAPARYRNSEAYFRMLMLVTVLQQDLGVRYNQERANSPDFRRSVDLFIHGMIPGATSMAPTGGTCVSMPVLYTAIAHRLGYPVGLVTTKAHVFCRWDGEYGGQSDRFNIEATGAGMNAFPDEHYMRWPFEVTDEEVRRMGFLKTLSADEALATFVAAAGHLMADSGDTDEASRIYQLCMILDPDNPVYGGFVESTQGFASSQQAFQDRIGARQQRISEEQQAMMKRAGVLTPEEVMEMNRKNMERGSDPNVPPIPGFDDPVGVPAQ